MSVLFCLPEVSLCQWISIYLLRFSAHMAPWLPQVILSHTPLCCVVVLSRSVVSDCATPWTVAHQAPLSTGILQARIPEWVAMLSSRGSSWLNLDWTGIELGSLTLQADYLPSEPPGIDNHPNPASACSEKKHFFFLFVGCHISKKIFPMSKTDTQQALNRLGEGGNLSARQY